MTVQTKNSETTKNTFLQNVFSVKKYMNGIFYHTIITVFGMKIKLKKEIYFKNIFVPIGRSCHCAMHLTELGLRTCSYPFDWIIPYNDAFCIESRFEYLIKNPYEGVRGFFDKEDLIKLDIENRSTNHIVLLNKRNGFVFSHDIEFDIEKEYKKNAKKYKRRFKRLNKHIKKACNINLFYMSNTWDQMYWCKYEIPDEVWKYLMYRLQKAYLLM